MTKKQSKPKRTVEEIFEKLCKQDEVFMEGIGCVKTVMKPKEGIIERQELDRCHIRAPKGLDPIEERAKEKLYKMLYQKKETKFRYLEAIGPTREEIQSKER